MLAAALLLGTTLVPRDRVSFDFGWRHRPGLHAGPVPLQPPPHPEPGSSPAEAAPGFDDSGWARVQLPHDGIIGGSVPSRVACPHGCSGHSYIARKVLWYRKAFRLPDAWRGSAIWLDFDGAFRRSTVWLNGERVSSHDCGYTPFRVRLDNSSLIAYGPGARNVVAVFVDPDNGAEGGVDHGSGWWYEGGGLYRHVWLVRTHHLHVQQDGLFAYSNVSFDKKDQQTDGGKAHGQAAGGGSWPAPAWQGAAGAALYRGVGRTAPVATAAAGMTAAGVTATGADSAAAAATATLHASATVMGTGLGQAACVSFSLSGLSGEPVASSAPTPLWVPADGGATATAALLNLRVRPWSARSPALYTVRADVWASPDGECATVGAQPPVDSVSVVHGFRSLKFDADSGFFLNEQKFKIRGFCDHNDFAVVGMAVPERVNLFRAQALRAIGGNGRRMSHNPPDVATLALYDRLGVIVVDENRLFANSTAFVHNMAALVRRDRNAPSVVLWSFCNEAGCEGNREAGGPRFADVVHRLDGSRPTLGNMFTFGDLLSDTIDVQGFSHRERGQLDACHASLPDKPIFMSECCSCNTERDEDEGCETVTDNPPSIGCRQKAFNGRCAQHYTNVSDGAAYAVGTMVWTLFDYYGEPSGGWPRVSSSYGQYDLAGFAKASAFWYRTQWLLRIPDADAAKPFATGGEHEVHLVESWEPPAVGQPVAGARLAATRGGAAVPVTGADGASGGGDVFAGAPLDGPIALGADNDRAARTLSSSGGGSGSGARVGIAPSGTALDGTPLDLITPGRAAPGAARPTRHITAYTSAPSVDLFVNGVSVGVRAAGSLPGGGPTWAEWTDVPWANATVLAVALADDGSAAARDSRTASGVPAALRLSVDAPSERTHTGSALFLDGHDTALVRAEVIDAAGAVVWGAAHNVSFEVVSGPGRVLGAHNGDTRCHEPNGVPWRSAYHGRVRAVVGVTAASGRSQAERRLIREVDLDAEIELDSPAQPIVLRAIAPGLATATVSIPTSTDAIDEVMAVAARGAGQPVPLYR